MREVQTLIFSKSKFSPSDARDWAKKHGYKATKVDVQRNTVRLRQVDPGVFAKDSFRTETVAPGVQAVYASRKAVRRNPRGRRPCAGLALVREDETLLLVAERGRGYSIPKGRLDKGEQHRQAAIREVGEETGVHVQRGRLRAPGRVCSMRFWVVDVALDELPDVLPRNWLQAEEVTWAGFVPLNVAAEHLPEWQLPILDHLEEVC
jgi:8-oxo-dGTP pyrophosphatase MutT (NUDIX family)